MSHERTDWQKSDDSNNERDGERASEDYRSSDESSSDSASSRHRPRRHREFRSDREEPHTDREPRLSEERSHERGREHAHEHNRGVARTHGHEHNRDVPNRDVESDLDREEAAERHRLHERTTRTEHHRSTDRASSEHLSSSDREEHRHDEHRHDENRRDDRAAQRTDRHSYEDAPAASSSDASNHERESRDARTYRAESAHRPYTAFSPAAQAGNNAGDNNFGDNVGNNFGYGAGGGQTVATRLSTATEPLAAGSPLPLDRDTLQRRIPLADERSFDPSADPNVFHPFDEHRAMLIGTSTALLGAIGVIVYLMLHLASHKDIALKDVGLNVRQTSKQQDEDRLAELKRQAQQIDAIDAQRTREVQAANDRAVQNQQLARKQQELYLASQRELQQQQEAEHLRAQQDTVRTEQDRGKQEDNQRRLYVTKIRLAKQAWDRGDTNEVLQLLEPYRNDEARKNFAWNYLWRAARSGGSNTLRGHSDVVRQTAFTPDGSQIVTFGDDGQLMVWDAAVGKKLQTVALERNVPSRGYGVAVDDQLARRASGLLISADGGWAAAYGKNLYLGSNIRQPDQVRPIADHQFPILSLAMSRDGRRIASADTSGDILVRDAVDGRVVQRLKGQRPQAMAFSSDGGVLFAGMQNGGVFVWDVGKGNLIGTRAFNDGINSMATSPDGSVVALAMGVRDGVVVIWEPTTGRLRGELRGHTDEVTRVVFSRDGKYLLTASRDKTVSLWSTSGGLLRTFRGHLADVEAVAFSSDGQKIASAGDDQSAILWNVDGGQPCDTLTDTPIDGWVSGLAFTPDCSQVIGTGSCEGAGDSYEAYLTSWNLADANRPGPLQTSSKAGSALAFSPDGRQMVVGESSSLEAAVKSRVRLWSLDPTRVITTVPKLVGYVHSVAYSPDGRFLAVATGDADERTPGSVQILEAATGTLRQTLPAFNGKVEAAFTADSRMLVTVASSTKRPAEIRMWLPATGELAGKIDNARELENLTTTVLSPDGRYLVTGHGDLANPGAADKAKIKIWDMARQAVIAQFPAAHPAAVTRLAFSRRGVLMASGDMAGNVRIWDFATQKLLPKQIAQQSKAIVNLTFDRLGEKLAVAADEKAVRVWHIDTARQLAILELSLGAANVVRYTQDGKLLAATTAAGGLFLWDSESYRPRAILRGEGNPAGQQGHGGVITCAAPLLTDKLLTGSTDKTVKIWDLKTRKVVATAFSFNQAVSCMATSPDGKTLAVGTGKYRSKFETGELVLCDLTGTKQPKSVSQGITVSSVAFAPGGNALAVCSLSPAVGQPSRAVSVIDLTSGRATPINSQMGQCVAFSPDGRWLAVGCTSGQIDLWPLDPSVGTKPFALQKHRGMVWTLAFSPDGKTLASGAADNNVIVWDTATGEDLLTLKHNGIVEALRFSPDGRVLATSDHEPSRGTICLWRAPADDDNPRRDGRLDSRLDAGPVLSQGNASFDNATTLRSNFPTATPVSTPVLQDRRSLDPVAPSPSGYSRPVDDRAIPLQPSGNRPLDGRPLDNRAGLDPSVPLRPATLPANDYRPTGDPRANANPAGSGSGYAQPYDDRSSVDSRYSTDTNSAPPSFGPNGNGSSNAGGNVLRRPDSSDPSSRGSRSDGSSRSRSGF